MVKNERDRGVVDIIPGTLATAPDVISSPEEEGSAERLEKLEIEKNSIDRSVGRSVDRSVTRDTHSADRRFLRGHEYATKNMHTRGNTRFERAIAQIFDFDRSYRLKFLLLWIFANIFLSSEPGGHVRFHESVRKEREEAENISPTRGYQRIARY